MPVLGTVLEKLHARRGRVTTGKRTSRSCVYNQPQPWHAQSALAHEVSLGVERLRGEDAFVAFCEAAFSEKNWDKFTDKFTSKR